MCVILHKTKEGEFNEYDIIDAYNDNPDGFGLMLQYNGSVYTEKGLYSITRVLETLSGLDEFVAHFRIRTKGDINDENCHPFYCGKGAFLMHNGTLPISISNKKMSDTWHFAKKIEELGGPSTKKINLIESVLENNRVIFMNHKTIRRLGKWEELEGNYWSNLRWQYTLKDFYNDELEYQLYRDDYLSVFEERDCDDYWR